MAKKASKRMKILSLALVVFMIVPMCLNGFSFSSSAAVPVFSTKVANWNIYGIDLGNDNAGREWVNEEFAASVDDQSHINITSPGRKIGALGWNEGAKILAVAENILPLNTFTIGLDLTKATFPMDKSALSVGMVSDPALSTLPNNDSTCIKGLGAIATGSNDICVTLNQIVLGQQTHLNKVTVYIGGEEVNSKVIDWILTTENRDITFNFVAYAGGTGSSLLYRCNIRAATHSGQTGASNGINIQSIDFAAPTDIYGYPAVFAGSFGDNTYAYPDITINNMSLNTTLGSDAQTEAIHSAEFAGYYSLNLKLDSDTVPAGVVDNFDYQRHFVGIPVTLPSFPETTVERDGITTKFDGWYENNVRVSKGGEFFFEEGEHTLVGKWVTGPTEYDINYRSQGGGVFSGTLAEGAPESYNTVDGAVLPDASLFGYTFAGWYDNAACTGSPVAAIAPGQTGAKTFYSKFNPNTYTITFDAQEGSNPPADIVRTYASASGTLPGGATAPAGKCLLGWSKTAGGNCDFPVGSAINDEQLYPGTNGGSVTLYAVYGVDNYYHITFDINCPDGSSINYTGASANSFLGSVHDIEKNQAVAIHAFNNKNSAYFTTAQAWSSLKGWASTKANADSGNCDVYRYTDNEEHTTNLDYAKLDPDGDHRVTLYATWQRVIEINAGPNGNGNVAYIGLYVNGDNSITDLPAGTEPDGSADEYENTEVLARIRARYSDVGPAASGALFDGWEATTSNGTVRVLRTTMTKQWLDSNCITGKNLVLNARWRTEGYTITYYNATTLLGTQTVSAPIPGEPVEVTLWGNSEFTSKCPGWTLIGWTTSYNNQWKTSGNGYGSTFFEPGHRATITGNITLYGWGTRTDLKLKYESNGGYWDHGSGSGAGNDTDTKTKWNNTFFATITPFTGGGGGTAPDTSWYRFPTETATLGREGYRMHTSLNYPTIPRFYTADGSNGIDSWANNGHGYDCWPDCEFGSYLASYLGIPVGGTLTLYAAWDPIIYYNMNYPGAPVVQDYNYITSNNSYTILGTGGYTMYSSSNSYEDRNCDNNNSLRANREGYSGPVSIPSRSGYTLRSWNTKPDGSGTTYALGRTLDVTRPLVLYAQWSRTDSNSVYIIYKDQGGSEYSGANLGTLPSVHSKTGSTNIPNGSKRGFTFGGWYTNSACTGTPVTRLTSANTSNTTLYAKWTPITCTVTFKSDDGSTTIGTANVNFGAGASYSGLTPSKPRTAQYSYTFNKWVTTPGGFTAADLSSVTSNITVYANYTKTINTYTVRWSVDGNIVRSDTYKYGATPKFRMADPEKEGATFLGWSPSIGTVTQDVTYVAQFHTDYATYTVTWINYDMSLLEQDTDVAEGSMPHYDGATPTRPDDSRYTYEFSGWDKELTPVIGNTVYTATFTRTAKPAANTYTVTWVNYDMSLLEQDTDVTEGSMPHYDGATPTRPDDSRYTYEFSGWDKELTPVIGNTVYTATFTRIAKPAANTYTVTWVNYDMSLLEQDTDVTVGSMPHYDGATPTRPDDSKYTYEFSGWDKELIPVTSNVIYTATFTRVAKTDDGRPVVSVTDYTMSVKNVTGLTYIRIAAGTFNTAGEIKNAPGCITINSAIIAANTNGDTMTYELPDGGIYSVWLKYSGGAEYIEHIDATHMTPYVVTDGVKVTVHNLYGIKDFFIARGTYTTYRQVKNADGCLGILSSKFGKAHSFTQTAAIGDPGEYTLYIRYNDPNREDEIIYFTCEVTYPTVDVYGRWITVGNLDGIRVIRVAPGTYSTSKDVKNAAGCRNFNTGEVAKLAVDGSLTVLNEATPEGTAYTVSIEYNNLYTEIHNITVKQKVPTYAVSGNSITFTGLEGLSLFRYAPGTFSTATEIKNAEGSQFMRPADVQNETITLTNLIGKYTFLVQYIENSANIISVDFGS